MAADLGGEVGVEAKALEVDAEHLRQPYNSRLLLAVCEAEEGRRRKGGKRDIHV